MTKDTPKIAVVGSSNMDLVVKSNRIPAVGETILGGDFIMVPGGKGANQAVAAAKLGAEVYFVAKLGNDVFAEQSLNNFRKETVNTKYVIQTGEAPSGVALILVDEGGNNLIVVAPGANQTLLPADIENAESDIASCGAVVAQLEVPLETIERAAKMANDLKVPFVLDPAPARELSPELLGMVDVLTPNETEAQILTGIEVTGEESARAASKNLLERDVKAVILTLGDKGFLLADSEQAQYIVGISENKALSDAALFANYVAALSVTKMGAQSSMPTLQEVESFMNR
jgi:ribokinase